MLLSDFSQQILLGGDIEDKLLDPQHIDFNSVSFELPKLPGRNNKMKISSKNVKFPRGHFHLKEKKAMALHSFANHELLATEMMAAALLLFPHNTEVLKRFKKGIISSLKDEQKHFKLYVAELNKLGYEFGDFELNGFFWNSMPKLNSPERYAATMALTFEAANLDFASFYRDIFIELGDQDIANVLEIVLKDEISHVGLGVNYLNRERGDSSLWDYYREHLPWPMTPARAKGKVFNAQLRTHAHLDQDFITRLESYKDDFDITNRKEWKQ